MYYFKQFVSHSHSQLLNGEAVIIDLDDPAKVQKISESQRTNILNLASKANIFVFDDAKPEGRNVEDYDSHVSSPEFIQTWSLPFRICWFENIVKNENILITKVYLDRNNSALIGCLIFEKSPLCFDIYVLEFLENDQEGAGLSITGFTNVNLITRNFLAIKKDLTENARDAITALQFYILDIEGRLNKIHKGLQVFEECNESARIPTHIKKGKQRYGHIEVKRIVRVVKRNVKRENVLPITNSGKIDWQHRWERIGHWRKLANGGLGKDRNGDYCIPGFTWVVETVCGPDDKPIIKKVRLVAKDSGESN